MIHRGVTARTCLVFCRPFFPFIKRSPKSVASPFTSSLSSSHSPSFFSYLFSHLHWFNRYFFVFNCFSVTFLLFLSSSSCWALSAVPPAPSMRCELHDLCWPDRFLSNPSGSLLQRLRSHTLLALSTTRPRLSLMPERQLRRNSMSPPTLSPGYPVPISTAWHKTAWSTTD